MSYHFYDLKPPEVDITAEVVAGLSASPKALSPKFFYDERGSEFTSAELWDPAKRRFKPAGALSTPREYATVTALPDGRVLVIGGIGPDAFLATAEVWDLATGELIRRFDGHSGQLWDVAVSPACFESGSAGCGALSATSTWISIWRG